MALHGDTATALVCPCVKSQKGTVLVGFHEKRSSFIADMKSCEILPKRVSDLLVPLRELINSLSLRKKLPQIELAVTDEALALVLRVLEKPTADDEAKLRQFQKDYGVDFGISQKARTPFIRWIPKTLLA